MLSRYAALRLNGSAPEAVDAGALLDLLGCGGDCADGDEWVGPAWGGEWCAGGC